MHNRTKTIDEGCKYNEIIKSFQQEINSIKIGTLAKKSQIQQSEETFFNDFNHVLGQDLKFGSSQQNSTSKNTYR